MAGLPSTGPTSSTRWASGWEVRWDYRGLRGFRASPVQLGQMAQRVQRDLPVSTGIPFGTEAEHPHQHWEPMAISTLIRLPKRSMAPRRVEQGEGQFH